MIARRRLGLAGGAIVVVVGIAASAIALGSRSTEPRSDRPVVTTTSLVAAKTTTSVATPTTNRKSVVATGDLDVKVIYDKPTPGARCVMSGAEIPCEYAGPTLVSEDAVRDVSVYYDQASTRWALKIEFDPEAARLLAEHAPNRIGFVIGENVRAGASLPRDLDGNVVSAISGYFDRAGAIWVATQILGHAPTHVEARELTARIELPSTELVAGVPVHGTLVFVNGSNQAITLASIPIKSESGCIPGWIVVLTSGSVPPSANFSTTCKKGEWVVPVGESRYPFTMLTTYQYCSSPPPSPANPDCLPGRVIPPLPLGGYRAVLTTQGVGFPIPAPVPVRLVSAAAR
jgi:hypothetical protein